VLELCDKKTLADKIKESSLTEIEALDIILQIVSAFVELPRLGLRAPGDRPATLLHRDIKPGNILFKNGKVKIADLGLAETVDVTKRNDQTHEKRSWNGMLDVSSNSTKAEILNKNRHILFRSRPL